MPVGIVACTFSDNLSRNSCRPGRLMPTTFSSDLEKIHLKINNGMQRPLNYCIDPVMRRLKTVS